MCSCLEVNKFPTMEDTADFTVEVRARVADRSAWGPDNLYCPSCSRPHMVGSVSKYSDGMWCLHCAQDHSWYTCTICPRGKAHVTIRSMHHHLRKYHMERELKQIPEEDLVLANQRIPFGKVMMCYADGYPIVQTLVFPKHGVIGVGAGMASCISELGKNALLRIFAVVAGGGVFKSLGGDAVECGSLQGLLTQWVVHQKPLLTFNEDRGLREGLGALPPVVLSQLEGTPWDALEFHEVPKKWEEQGIPMGRSARHQKHATDVSGASMQRQFGIKPGDYNLDCTPGQNELVEIPQELATQVYCTHQQGHVSGGAYHIVQQAIGVANSDDTTSAPEVEYHVRLASLLHEMTHAQGTQLYEVLQLAVRMARDENGLVRTGVHHPPVFPTSQHHLRRMYTKGLQSIGTNVPHPKVQDLQGHGYVALKEVIVYHLGVGKPIQGVSEMAVGADVEVECVAQTRRAQEIRRVSIRNKDGVEVMVLWIICWSDDCDPYSVRKNKKSTWVFTVTISSPHATRHGPANMYPIALGAKGDDHSPILAAFSKDLHDLQEGYWVYSGWTQGPVFISGGVFVRIMDTPERGAICLFRTSGRCGHTFLDPIRATKYLPSCVTCRHQRVTMIRGLEDKLQGHDTDFSVEVHTPCQTCANWETDHPLLGTRTPASLLRLLPGKDMFLCVPMTFEQAKADCRLAHDGLLSGTWTTAQVETFLKLQGLNAGVITRVKMHGQRAHQLNTAEEGSEQWRELQADFRCDPRLFECVNPAEWSLPGVNPVMDVSARMHLFALGLNKTQCKLFVQVANSRGQGTTLDRILKPRLHKLCQFRLSWLKVEEWGVRGGYVAENWLALAWLGCWFWKPLEGLPLEAEDLGQLPVLPPGEGGRPWLVKELKRFLENRGIASNGCRADLELRVHAHFMAEEVPQVDCPSVVLSGLTSAFVALLGHVFNHRATSVRSDLIGLYAKTWLTLLDQFDQAAAPGRDKAAWVDKKNCFTLLDVHGEQNLAGDGTFFWDGDAHGEGGLREVKPVLARHGTHGNRGPNCLRALYTQRGLQQVLHDVGCGSVDVPEEPKMVHVYKSVQDIHSDFHSGEPLSIVFDAGVFFSLLTVTGEVHCRLRRVVLHLEDIPKKESWEASYFPFSFKAADPVDVPLDVTKDDWMYGVALPLSMDPTPPVGCIPTTHLPAGTRYFHVHFSDGRVLQQVLQQVGCASVIIGHHVYQDTLY